jgi:ABC-2 type transport system ATP-binding protein
MCDRVGILNRGRLVEYGKLSEILKSRANEIEAIVSGAGEQALKQLGKFALEVRPTPEGARIRLRSDRDISRLLDIVHRAGGRLVSVNPVRESLEELFVREVSGSEREFQQAKS